MILLPAELRALLVKAFNVKNTAADPLAQRKAIDSTIDFLKTQYPQYFIKEI